MTTPCRPISAEHLEEIIQRHKVDDDDSSPYKALFHLCRDLKCLPEIKDCYADDLQAVVTRWYSVSPALSRLDLEDVFFEFADKWDSVWADSEDAALDCFKRARELPTAQWLQERYSRTSVQTLAKVCYLLDKRNREQGRDRFFLGSTKAANLLGDGVTGKQADLWLKEFCREGKRKPLLVVVEKGQRWEKGQKPRATEYRYVGPSPLDTP